MFPQPSSLGRLALVSLGLAITALTTQAQLVYTQGHGDLGVAYEGGALEPHWHLHGGSVVQSAPLPADAEYAPGEILAFVAAPSIPRPAGADWNFLGISAGSPLWFLPQVQDGAKPFLGIASEELVPSEWAGLTLSLTGMTAPAGGQFSLWSNGAFGVPDVKFATADGITAGDRFSMIVGSHAHYNFGFTQPGIYQVTLEWEGQHLVDGLVKASGTFALGVTAVPEPGETVALGLAGVAAFAGWRRFQARRVA